MGKTITLNHITKIEGHAKLNLKIEEGKVETCELSAVEGSRYFEGIVIGRQFHEAGEMTSRICGICSCAHVVAATMAVEDAIGFTPSEQTNTLRVLLTLGERIRSHATHLYFLALPDYLGYESALAMAPKYKKELQSALRMMRIGNKIIKVLAGRDLHPVSVAVGGWLKLPTQKQMDELKEDLLSMKEDALATCKLFSSLKCPDISTEGELFSLVDDNRYAVLSGTFASATSSFEKHRYREFLREYHEEYSTANFVVKDDHRYTVGALSRINQNHRFLSNDAKKMLEDSPLTIPGTNPFHNNIAQAIEIVHSIDHGVEICETLQIQDEPYVRPQPRAGTGVGCIEVPRGTLWHEYTINDKGVITGANIITPTAQNLLNMQEDIRNFIPQVLDKTKEELVLDVEKLIRSYDPCFSCSAHFLEVNWL